MPRPETVEACRRHYTRSLIGRLSEALALSVLTVVILMGLRYLERAFKRLGGGSDEPDDDIR